MSWNKLPHRNRLRSLKLASKTTDSLVAHQISSAVSGLMGEKYWKIWGKKYSFFLICTQKSEVFFPHKEGWSIDFKWSSLQFSSAWEISIVETHSASFHSLLCRYFFAIKYFPMSVRAKDAVNFLLLFTGYTWGATEEVWFWQNTEE